MSAKKNVKCSAYKTIGRTSDGIVILKPKAVTSRLTELGSKVARSMAKTRSMQATDGEKARAHLTLGRKR